MRRDVWDLTCLALLLVTASDEDHGSAAVEQRPLLPVSVHVLDGEPGLKERAGELFEATKAQFVAGDKTLASGEEDVVTFQVDPAITHTNDLKPRFHWPIGGVEPLMCGLAGPPLPGTIIRIAALESEMTTWAESGVKGPQSGQPLCVLQKHLSDVTRHDHQVDVAETQGVHITFDPSHPVGTRLLASDGQHRRRWVNADYLPTAGCQLARQDPGSTAHVDNAVGV